MNHSSHYNPQHRHLLRLLFALVLSCVVVPSMAQVGEEAALKMSDVDMDSPTFRPTVHTGKALVDGDSVQYVKTNNVYVFPKIEFKTPEERAKFYRLLYNIKCCRSPRSVTRLSSRPMSIWRRCPTIRHARST